MTKQQYNSVLGYYTEIVYLVGAKEAKVTDLSAKDYCAEIMQRAYVIWLDAYYNKIYYFDAMYQLSALYEEYYSHFLGRIF